MRTEGHGLAAAHKSNIKRMYIGVRTARDTTYPCDSGIIGISHEQHWSHELWVLVEIERIEMLLLLMIVVDRIHNLFLMVRARVEVHAGEFEGRWKGSVGDVDTTSTYVFQGDPPSRATECAA